MLVNDSVAPLLQVLDLMFSMILMLLMGLHLPDRHCKNMQAFLDTFQDFNLITIRNQFRHCSLESDIVLESVDELFFSLQRVNVSDIHVATNKNLCLSDTTIGSRGVGVQCVGGDRLPVTNDIEHRIRRLVSVFEQCAGGQTGKLCHVLDGLFDGFDG